MRAAIFLLLVFAATVTAFCPFIYLRQYVYAKGQAKVKVYAHYELKGLRVELVSYFSEDPKNVTVLASANADDTGFYVITGSERVGCYRRRKYGLRLYAKNIATFPVEVGNGGKDDDRIEVPWQYVLGESQPVKLLEKDIDGVLNIRS